MSVPRKHWTQQIAQWFEAAESKIPEPDFIKGDFPDWVQRVSRELLKTLFPEAKFAIGREWSARELGAIIGHQVAFSNALKSLPDLHDRRVFKKIDTKVRKRLQRQFRDFAKCRELAVQRSLVLASKQSYEDAAQFFTAFSRALNRRPADANASNFHRPNTRIYWLLLQGWKSVVRLRSVRELQQGLCRYMEPHLVGDIKRIEKMCQRLGLHFAPPGRPKEK